MKDELTIYKYGIENIVGIMKKSKFSLLRELKIVVYYVTILIFNKTIASNEKNVLLINGMPERNDPFSERFPNKIYRGTCYNSFDEIRLLPTIVSPFSYKERIGIFCLSIKSYLFNKKDVFNFSTWLEFKFLSNYLKKANLDEFVSRGHYDEVTTWIGYLSENYGFSYVMYQHGVVLKNTMITNKIPCNKFFGFDKYSLSVFKENYISKKECQYKIYDFESSVEFAKINREEGYFYIGIVEQLNKNWVEEVVNTLLELSDRIKIIIMPHPLSKNNYQKFSHKVMVSKMKYSNLDFLITESSTLIIDYFRGGKGATVICTNVEMQEAFSDYPVTWITIDSDFKKKLARALRRREEGKIM